MARKRAENREGSLGFPGFVKPVFTKDSKPLGKRKKFTRVPRERETRTHLKKFSSDKNSHYLINMPRFCNKTFKRRKFGSSQDSSASEDLKKDNNLQGIKIKIKRQKARGQKKSLGGRNRLTDAEIDKLQIYYGFAIRNNSGNLSAMKQAIWAIFFHKISTDLNPPHGLCPLGDDSWCGYNRSKLKGDTYKHKHNLPIAIMHCIKKVFRDLSSPELLSRCLHGKTQNCNESLNSVIWSIIPKTVFVQLGTLKTGVYESISIYNQGLITKLKVLDLLNIQPGFYTCRALQEADHARIRKAEKAISRRTKEARIKNRQLKYRQEDDLADDPSNPSYGSGMY
ncbi:uncharacterized protein TNCV_1393081 [Trichonephila clavipes]|nr:uncharacterized protein TNCV_1393081 [Trichonephila clavipes]